MKKDNFNTLLVAFIVLLLFTLVMGRGCNSTPPTRGPVTPVAIQQWGGNAQ